MKDYKLKKDEYINPCDGLVWCRKCNSPRQIKVSGGIYSLSPMVRCSCQQKEWDKEKKREKKRTGKDTFPIFERKDLDGRPCGNTVSRKIFQEIAMS